MNSLAMLVITNKEKKKKERKEYKYFTVCNISILIKMFYKVHN